MKKRNCIISLLLAASAPLVVAAPVNAEVDFAQGRILVEPQAGMTGEEFEKSFKSLGGIKAHKLGQSNIHIIDVPHGSEKALVNKLKHNPHYKFAELDVRVPIAAVLNDPYLGSEWHINKIGAPAAWDSAQGAGITIAILDTGVDSSHPDLAPHMVAGWDIYGNTSNTSDLCGHGTAVAGSAAAAGNNGVGVSGVSGQSKIMPLRIAYKGTDGLCYAYASTIASGVTYAADHGAKVANVSFSNAANSTAVQSAGNYLKSKGGLLFVSANNNARDEGFTPSTALIAVSSTDSNDNLSSFSSYGAFVSLSAPGSNIYTTNNGGGYGGWNGTSFSSPVAAGAAALVMSANPTLTADQVQNILFSTAVDLGAAGRDIYFGYGRVDAAAAVSKARGTQVVADSTKPVVSIAAPLGSSTVSGLVPVSVNATDNVGVARVELKVNSTVVATDTSAPFAFSWDSKGVSNGMVSLTAVAYDAAGNVASSTPVSVNVANTTTTIVTTDTTPPAVRVTNPVAGRVNGNVNVSVSASDNQPVSELVLSLYVDGVLRASGAGSSLSYNWQTNREAKGTHSLKALAKDKAGNSSSYTVNVTR
ncbi:S8 family serine peptidase [Pseudoduganella eburnea]|uniref:S8 family serine peptidase n=2 Tax=Massilia eburnea TaxID=1776165 RepID=A0A6L6QKC3_9BURK|nr:S8 family serine peptidase [Massilia eburnea]MTW12719.1 S8 family serine peptidase [Massilia eburnea]